MFDPTKPSVHSVGTTPLSIVVRYTKESALLGKPAGWYWYLSAENPLDKESPLVGVTNGPHPTAYQAHLDALSKALDCIFLKM